MIDYVRDVVFADLRISAMHEVSNAFSVHIKDQIMDRVWSPVCIEPLAIRNVVLLSATDYSDSV